MEKRRKNFSYYLDFMDLSIIVFTIYAIINMLFPLVNFLGNTITSLISFAVTIFIFGNVGYKISKEKDAEPAKAGAYTGIVVGLISAILAIITFYFFPASLADSIQKAVQAGADRATVETFMKIGLFAGLLITPAIYAAIGALLVWISKLIFRKKQEEKPKDKKHSEKKK